MELEFNGTSFFTEALTRRETREELADLNKKISVLFFKTTGITTKHTHMQTQINPPDGKF